MSVAFGVCVLPCLLVVSAGRHVSGCVLVCVPPAAELPLTAAVPPGNSIIHTNTGATIWCFFAAIQAVWAVLTELLLCGQSWAPASAGEMAAVGKWRSPPSSVQQQKQQAAAGARGAQPLLLDSPSDRAALDDGGDASHNHSKAQ